MKKRTNIDFSGHQLIIQKNEHLESFYLKKPDTITCGVKFTNVCGKLLVTGDFGNWVFCRTFTPHADASRVSDGYWCEKLEIHSVQISTEFDADETENEIKELIENLNEYDWSKEHMEQLKEYYQNLLDNVHCGEFDYSIAAYREYKPDFVDYDDIPFCKNIRHRLLIIFDAFEKICRILKSEPNKIKQS